MSIVSITAPADAAVIRAPGVLLALWRRILDPAVAAWLESLPADRLPHGRLLVTADTAGDGLRSLAAGAGIPECPEARWLWQDITALVALFAQVSGTPQVDVRLEAIGHDACWRFHYDMVPLRLVTTYRGPGTQWVQPEDGKAALRDQKSFSGLVNRLAPGHVAVFKGARAPDGGIVHRSPPMAGSGETRLFLCLNLPSDISPEPFSPAR